MKTPAILLAAGLALTDGEAEELEGKYLRDWFDTRIRIDRLRAEWLERRYL